MLVFPNYAKNYASTIDKGLTIPNYLMCWKLRSYAYLHFGQTTLNFAAATQGEIFDFTDL